MTDSPPTLFDLIADINKENPKNMKSTTFVLGFWNETKKEPDVMCSPILDQKAAVKFAAIQTIMNRIMSRAFDILESEFQRNQVRTILEKSLRDKAGLKDN